MRRITMFCLLLAFGFIKWSSGDEWCYQSQFSCSKPCKAPLEWTEVSATCGGDSQSPVNIVTKQAFTLKSLKSLFSHGYQLTFNSTIANTGYSVQINLPENLKIFGGNLETTYKAVQLHFHWGNNGSPGSEHTIDGVQYPMELHIVHIKEQYQSLADALEDETGVAVIGFFYEESQKDNKNYEFILKALQDITLKGTHAPLSYLSLSMLIPPPQTLTKYYRYKGSLTVPGCAESLVWTLFDKPIPLSKEQLSAFSRLKYGDGQTMTDNFRRPQPLNGRVVRSCFGTSCFRVSSS